MTSSQPSLAKRIYEEGQKIGIETIDAPVSGGDVGAKNGCLTIMVGGNEKTVNYVKPIFNIFGKSINLMGGAGMGHHTKMANQIFIASTMMSVVEGVIYSYKAGLDVNQVLECVSQGAAASFSMSSYAPRMLKRDFEPGFYVDHFIKDMEICLEECKRMKIILPGLQLSKQFYESVKAYGFEKKGSQALILALEKFNNIELPIMEPPKK
jgi:3-hydroxyisobutyrate dehydrogenase